MGINKVVLIGRLTKDVELRATPSGSEVCWFTLAVDDYNGKENVAYFIGCVAWNQTAKFVTTYCKKGALIAVDGKLQTRSYDRNDGIKVYVTEVLCANVQLLQSKPKEEQQHTPDVKEEDSMFSFNTDDLPF